MAGETTIADGAKPNWFAMVSGLLTPQQAQLTPIRTDDPISEKQQQTNQMLFIMAMVVVLIVTGGAVYYFLKK